MTELFSREGQASLKKFMRKKIIIAFDYDGTLVPIKKLPGQARLDPRTEDLLLQLRKKVPVAVVSGRSRKDLRKKFNVKPQFLVGNHGIENLKKHHPKLKDAVLTCRNWLKQIKKTQLPAGVWIENKKYSLTFHYRKSTSRGVAKKKILKMTEVLQPQPQIILGKCVVNLLTPTSPHKGEALQQICRLTKIKNVFFIGDDDTDEMVFRMKKQEFFSVRVRKKQDSAARFFIKNQTHISRVLKFLLKNLEF